MDPLKRVKKLTDIKFFVEITVKKNFPLDSQIVLEIKTLRRREK